MTLLDLKDKIKRKLRITSANSNFWSDDLIEDELNDSQDWLADLYNFSILEKSFSRASIAGQPYYGYPDVTNSPYAFKDDSISSLYVNGIPYSKFEYDDFKTFILKL
jgi:hypothetical protein